MIRRPIALLLLLSACSWGVDTPAAQRTDSTAPPAGEPGQDAPGVLVTRRAGTSAFDTARILAAAPLVSTAGWTSFVVSYETNLTLGDSVALAAQADSVFQDAREIIAARPDTTAIMEANVRRRSFGGVSRGGGFRFVYHRLPDGSWDRIR